MMATSRPELAALVDLGLAHDTIAKYLQIPAGALTELQNRYRVGDSESAAPGDTAVPEPASKGAPAAAITRMREQSRLLMAESKITTDPGQRARSAERAFELAQLAECEERRLLDMAATLGSAADARTDRNNHVDAAAVLLDKARRWRMRAEEYRTVSEALRTPIARETYAHLAHSYERLADQFEARANLAFVNRPSSKDSCKEQTG